MALLRVSHFRDRIRLTSGGRKADWYREFRCLSAWLLLGAILATVLICVACGSPSESGTSQPETTTAGAGPPSSVPLPSSPSHSPSPQHQVVLSWEASASQDVIGYHVYRSLQSGGPYTRLNAQPVGDTEYTDTAVMANTTYYYVVTAVAENGLESVYSNEAPATVPSS